MRLLVDDHTSLRSIQEADAADIFGLVDANRDHLREWLPWLDSNRSVDDTLAFIRFVRPREAEGRAFTGVVEHDGEVCGLAAFNFIDPVSRACEIGYWLRRDRQGRGIVSACCRSLIEHAFDSLNLNRVNIPVAVGNAKSRAIPERLGFHIDGRLRDAEWLYDHYVDHVLYTLLRRDRSTGSE
jgi:ribosomal-protein-serine acetyltransferase